MSLRVYASLHFDSPAVSATAQPVMRTAQQTHGMAEAPGEKGSTLSVCVAVLLGDRSKGSLHSWRELELCFSQKKQ